MRTIAASRTLLFLLISVAITIAVVSGLSWLNHYKHDGELRLSGLKQPVSVVRDEKGMAYIYAQNHWDATRAQGFITAQDRLFSMEMTRRMVTGRLAEIMGDTALKADIEQRTVGIHRAAKKHFDLLNDRDKRYLQHYVDGINAYIQTRSEEHPIKLNLAGIELEPWTPADSLAIFYLFGWGSSSNLKTEIINQLLVDKVGLDKAQQIFALNINPDDENKTGAGPEISHNSNMSSLNLMESSSLNSFLEQHPLQLGSNNWSVSGELSEGGKPIVANDPHLKSNILPGPAYPMAIITPEYRIVGSGIAGMPTMLIGRTEHVAIGATNGYGDTQDLYVETIDPQNPSHYLEGTKSLPLEIIEETFRVKDDREASGYRKVNHNIRLTRRGPLVSGIFDGLNTDKALSMRWSMLEAMEPSIALDGILFAQSVDDVRTTLSSKTMISANWVFADIHGNIGYQASGRIPIRRQGESWLPYPVTSDKDNWIGWIPTEHMPQSENPSRGWVGTANQKVVGDDYPYYYSSYFSHSYRYQRMRELLDSRRIMSIDDHWQYQRDTKNMMAVTIAPRMAEALLKHQDTLVMGKVLDEWNHHDDIDLAAPAIFHSTYQELAKLVFEDELGEELAAQMLEIRYLWQERLEKMIMDAQSPWFDITTSRASEETLDDLLYQAAIAAKNSLQEKMGEDPMQWRWGEIHTIEFNSPLRSKGFGKSLLGAGTHPFPGSGETIHRAAFGFAQPFDTSFSASLRMIADLSDTEKVLAVIPGGTSGRLFSPHRDDQVQAFVTGEKRYWWFSDEKISQHAVSRLELIP
ncbi:penicillin acylase family protein [Pseudomaricurvus alkylphenolicus]|uniref:penicillin acylase family protein n=1 Tax=Pseudomaricurvus alkylphenolicus TaxID=1306991 RepID=UPI001422EC14|nr:penicillin acylase family protein [Pseudomaricurvus alkylphenolicus]NIB41712.1 penicillin acylase family protein [Pseudomaricurvus alkylphenolicus]